MKTNRLIPILLALVIFTGVFSFSAYAYTPPEADGGASPSPSAGNQSESAIPKSGNTITPDGTGTVVDKLSSKDGKEFYTITTPEENIFYLVIDTLREDENVYFLNAVTEDDLMALAEKKEDGAGTSTSAIPAPSPSPQETEPSPSPEPSEAPPAQGGNGTLIFIIIAAIAVGGAGYYFKILRPKQQADYDEPEDDDYDYGETSENDDYETESEDE